MDPVNSLTQVLAVLRRQMSEKGAKVGGRPTAGSSLPPAAAPSAEELRDVQKKIAARIRALDPDDERRQSKAVRIFLEGVLLGEFGDALLTDPAFYTLVDDVQSAMEADAGVKATLHQLVARLAEEG